VEAIEQATPAVDIATACRALGMPRASFYRHRDRQRQRRVGPPCPPPRRPRPSPPRTLSLPERRRVLDLLHGERFVDAAPAQVYATLLDEGQYLCSVRTMYRLLAANAEVRERRQQRRHPAYSKPERLATGPNQVWSWDITKLKGPIKGTWLCLYVILDIFSRAVVGWTVADRESAVLAERLIGQTVRKQGVARDRLTLHADRGAAMTSKAVSELLADLGVARSHSRPQQSNDNPFSEAQFKTLKYHPDFPERFGSIQDARLFCRAFFAWYNTEHRHSGLGLMTPHQVHYGDTGAIRAARQAVLDEVHRRHPERFVRQPPTAPAPPAAVWINPPDRGLMAACSSRCSAQERPSRRPGLPIPPPAREGTGKVVPEGPAPRSGRKGLARPECAGTLEADGDFVQLNRS
jgi:putative transposase